MSNRFLFDRHLIASPILADGKSRRTLQFNHLGKCFLFDGCLIGGFATSTNRQDRRRGKVGYEINFNRVFFQYKPPRPLQEIDKELEAVEKRIMEYCERGRSECDPQF